VDGPRKTPDRQRPIGRYGARGRSPCDRPLAVGTRYGCTVPCSGTCASVAFVDGSRKKSDADRSTMSGPRSEGGREPHRGGTRLAGSQARALAPSAAAAEVAVLIAPSPIRDVDVLFPRSCGARSSFRPRADLARSDGRGTWTRDTAAGRGAAEDGVRTGPGSLAHGHIVEVRVRGLRKNLVRAGSRWPPPAAVSGAASSHTASMMRSSGTTRSGSISRVASTLRSSGRSRRTGSPRTLISSGPSIRNSTSSCRDEGTTTKMYSAAGKVLSGPGCSSCRGSTDRTGCGVFPLPSWRPAARCEVRVP
jgi:hypothetical protein